MGSRFDIIVVGAGPAGCIASKVCAESGLKVALLEKHRHPGMKVCAGAIGDRVLHEFDVDNNVIECLINSSCRYAGNLISVGEWDGATVYRRNFDNFLAEQAVNAGVELFTSTQSTGVLIESGKVVGVGLSTPSGLSKIHGDVVIGADGFYSVIARSAGFYRRLRRTDFYVTVQRELFTARNVNHDSLHDFYGNDISGVGYGWIFPKRRGYTVGICCLSSFCHGNELLRNLDYFINRHPIASGILRNVVKKGPIEGACIPVQPLDRICDDGVVIVGDAACQTSPLTGEGIYYAMWAGKIAGEVVVKAVTDEDVSREALIDYEKRWKTVFGKSLKLERETLDFISKFYSEIQKTRVLVRSNRLLKKFYSWTILKPVRAFCRLNKKLDLIDRVARFIIN